MRHTAMSALGALAFLLLIGMSCSETPDCSYKGLLKHLEQKMAENLLVKLRPARNWTEPTLVLVDLFLFGIIEVNEKLQTLSSQTWHQVWWANEFLAWNVSDFCGIQNITLPRTELWQPDVFIHEDSSDSGASQKSASITVYYNGWMTTVARQRLTSTCQLKLAKFPFDKQSCTITFSSMSYDYSSMTIKPFNNETVLSSVSEDIMLTQGEWQLDYLDIPKDASMKGKLVYTINISRRPMLYVVIFIVPLFYLLILDLASFLINEAGGEKLSFKVTVLLSISVLLLILKDMLPSTEDYLPLIASYCVAIFAMVGLSVLETMLINFLFDLDNKCCEKAQCSASDLMDIEVEAEAEANKEPAEEIGNMKMEKLVSPLQRDLLKQVLEEVKAARREAARKDKGPARTYRRVAQIIDYVYHVFYLLTVGVFLAFMYYAWLRM